jgi:hypothetical protein
LEPKADVKAGRDVQRDVGPIDLTPALEIPSRGDELFHVESSKPGRTAPIREHEHERMSE